jgi:poly-gamma-glutamate capsule biosynthesis protein CapA/YwtB (metallophosphatase superfamily)
MHIEISDNGNESTWSVVLVGDCIYENEMASDPVGEELQERIQGSDLALVNLEASVPVDREPINKTGPVKESVRSAPKVLATAGFEVACLASNHIMDFGPEGLRATQQACYDAGLKTVGAGENIDDALSPLFVSIKDDNDNNDSDNTNDGNDNVSDNNSDNTDNTDDNSNDSNGSDDPTFAIINVCEKEFSIADDGPGTGWISHPTVKQRIERAGETADIVLVVAHGGIEYVPFPPFGRQRTLRSFVNSGADAVIGHHPHVAQGWEVYDGSPIVYSLGNFLFRQSRPSTSWGLAVSLSGHGSEITGITFVLTDQRDGHVYEMNDPSSHLAYLERVSDITEDRNALQAHWQELAVQVFEQRYSDWLRIGTAAGPIQALRNPRAALGAGTWDATRRIEMLTLLNVIRNESHRDVIETALSVKTGNVTDKRTPEIRQTVRDLLSWTEDQPVYDRPPLYEQVIQTLMKKSR